MIRKAILSAFLLFATGMGVMAAPSDNYGTEVATQLVERANALFNKGKYSEAKVLYSEALATGDAMFSKVCSEKLRVINTLMAKEKTATTVFSISQDTVKINYLGGDYPIHVTGDKWSATTQTDEDWCKIDVDRKKGLVKITSSPNESTDARSTVITIRNGNGQKKSVEVINEGSPEILRSSAQNLVFTPSGETNVVDIESNTPWKVTDVPSWLKAIKGAGDIQFTALANDENRDRIAQVKVETPSRQEIIINIIQSAALDSLAFSKNNLQFGPDGGDEYIHVYTDAKDWRFGDFPHWCQLERVNDNTIKVHCTPNEPVDMPREASINVTNGTQTLGINVYQAPKPIVHIIPVDGIGGRRISFGFSAGYIYPMIDAKSSSPYTYSAVNYANGTQKEAAKYSSSGGFSIAAFADIRLYKNLYLNAGLNFLWYKYKNEISGTWTMTMPATANRYLKGEGLASFKEDYTTATLDVPVLLSYRIPVTKKSNFQVNLGPVLSIGMSSNMKLTGNFNSERMYYYKIVNNQMTNDRYDNYSYSTRMNYDGKLNMYSGDTDLTTYTSFGQNETGETTDEKLSSSPYNRFNFGLRAGIGYEYMGISLNISYQYMITNMGNKTFWDGDRWKVFKNATDLMTGYSQRNNLLLFTVGYTFRY